MITTDPISDLLNRIKNAARARKESVSVSHSKIKEQILDILKKRSFISDFSVETDDQKHRQINVVINPTKMDIEVKRVSKPGRRIYVKSAEIKKVNGGLGVCIISTPKGLTTGEEAVKMNLGGEYLCQIY